MELTVLDTEFRPITDIDSFKSMIWSDRYGSCGDFELYLSMHPLLLSYLKPDYYLIINESERVMIIEGILVETDAEEGNHLVVTGRSIETILDRKIIWTQTKLTGNLQEAIKRLLMETIITPTIPDRKIDNFIFETSVDPKIVALTVNAQLAVGDNLYSSVQDLCNSHHLGFKILLNDKNQFVFSLYFGVDRSYAQAEFPYVIFSPNLDNIISSNYFTSKENLRNVTLIVGEGDGADRKTETVGSEKGLARRELFTDARDLSSTTDTGPLSPADYLAQLRDRGIKNLAVHSEKTAFEGEVDATQRFRYGQDFFIGDIVQIEDEYGNEGTAYISELILSQSEEGISVRPTFETTKKEGGEL